ncbi:hypothetical protein N7517_010418 [Penicillium concentricum]|uniref:Uncharacterized protein n=1 Tax=Penicillium concentricum TaxID=293559 RepID=A0A9W9UTB2_9EURO|nr:uncharacterized protein N7517_010418 [Penicillium concentricum]KAJ5355809.1 hypothetical protein N7517_010418 [Penicillium concentricum]
MSKAKNPTWALQAWESPGPQPPVSIPSNTNPRMLNPRTPTPGLTSDLADVDLDPELTTESELGPESESEPEQRVASRGTNRKRSRSQTPSPAQTRKEHSILIQLPLSRPASNGKGLENKS